MANNQEFFTVQELAEKLKVNIITVYRKIKSGDLVAHRIGKDYRIEKKDFERFLNETKTK